LNRSSWTFEGISFCSSEVYPNLYRLNVEIDSKLTGLADHFPGSPILPGFRQLECIDQWVKHCLGNSRVSSFAEVRFLKKIIPPCALEFEFKLGRDISFTMSDGTDIVTRGKFKIDTA